MKKGIIGLTLVSLALTGCYQAQKPSLSVKPEGPHARVRITYGDERSSIGVVSGSNCGTTHVQNGTPVLVSPHMTTREALTLQKPAATSLGMPKADKTPKVYYDTVLDFTWMADANYAKTIGFSDTGLISQQGADFLADGYLYFNAATGVLHSDWRLPTLGPDVGDYDPFLPDSNGRSPNGQGATGTGWGTPDDSGIYSELGWMYYANLGGLPRCEAVGPGPCEFNPNYGLPDLGGGPDVGPQPAAAGLRRRVSRLHRVHARAVQCARHDGGRLLPDHRHHRPHHAGRADLRAKPVLWRRTRDRRDTVATGGKTTLTDEDSS